MSDQVPMPNKYIINKSQFPMTNDQSNSNIQNPKQKYNLEERTTKFAEKVIDFLKQLPKNTITLPLINQLIRAGTSIGANYSEANEASSKKDFINKISIAKKECNETKYWLKIIAHAIPKFSSKAQILWREAQELNLILAAIIRNAKKN